MDATTVGLLAGVVGAVTGVVALAAVHWQRQDRSHDRSRHAFLSERRDYELDRQRLSRVAAGFHLELGHAQRLGRTHELTRAEWLAAEPIPLERVTVVAEHTNAATAALLAAYAPHVQRHLPRRPDGTPYRSRGEAWKEVESPAPGMWEDLPCYRLRGARIEGDRAELRVDEVSFYEGVNTTETLPIEVLRSMRKTAGLDLRAAMGPLRQLERNPAHSAVSTLTLCREPDGSASFLLHRRNGYVGDGTNHLHVVPAGVFQPGADGSFLEDADLWRNIVREYIEEIIDGTEAAAKQFSTPPNFDVDEPFASFDRLRRAGQIRPYFLGLGLDPLQLQPQILTVCVFDRSAYEELFGDRLKALRVENPEGQVVGATRDEKGLMKGYPFRADVVTSMVTRTSTVTDERLISGAAAVLECAFGFHDQLLS